MSPQRAWIWLWRIVAPLFAMLLLLGMIVAGWSVTVLMLTAIWCEVSRVYWVET